MEDFLPGNQFSGILQDHGLGGFLEVILFFAGWGTGERATIGLFLLIVECKIQENY